MSIACIAKSIFMSEPVGTGDMLGRTPWSEHRRSSASKTWGLREKYSEKIVPYFHICACFFAVNSRNSILKTPGRPNRSQTTDVLGFPRHSRRTSSSPYFAQRTSSSLRFAPKQNFTRIESNFASLYPSSSHLL